MLVQKKFVVDCRIDVFFGWHFGLRLIAQLFTVECVGTNHRQLNRSAHVLVSA